MKAKVSIGLLVLLFVMQSSVRAQGTDCYDIQCPDKILAPCEGVYGAHVWFSVVVSNRCPALPPPTVTYSKDPGSIFPSGTTTVCASIHIPGLPDRECCFDVIVDRCCSTNCIDVICSKDIMVPCEPTPMGIGAMVVLPEPQATNRCGDHLLPATLFWRSTPPVAPNQPAFFPAGTNKVVWCLTDGVNYFNCCSFDVIVTNCPPETSQCRPRIICPTAVEIQCEGTGGGIAFFPSPTIIDPCGLVVATNCTHVSGAFFPNGKTTVACCIVWRDPATGLPRNECCTFDVVVRCCPPPTNCVSTLLCPTNLLIDCPSAAAGGIPLNYSVTGSNTCEQTQVICVPPPGAIVFGNTNVCCRLVTLNALVLAQCCFPVLVNDTVPPVIDCPPDITVLSSNCLPVAIPIALPSVFDNCDPNPVVTCSPLPANGWPCGTTTVTCVATDASGNSNKCSFNVTVICNGGTEISCPPDIFRCSSPTGVVVTWTITATNRCTNIVSLECNPPSGTIFLPGSHQVCCRAIDGNNDITRCCFKVEVVLDDIPPVIVCPTNIVVVSPNCVPILVPYPLPLADDNCRLDYVRCDPPPTTLFPIGVTPVICCAFDKAGNSNCCNFTVTVRCPTNDCIRIVCPSNIVVECAGPNGVPVIFDAHAIDICTGGIGILPVTCSQPSGSVFPPGVTTVCCTNKLAGFAPQWCCFDVEVRRDLEPPVINCPSNIHVLCAKPNGEKVKYDVTVSDKCDPAPIVVCNPPSGSNFPIGCTNVTCVATDQADNSSTCTFKVCVLRQGCYLKNPSFELLNANLPAPLLCGDPLGFATDWTALSGAPVLFRPPFSSFIPGNCRGREDACQGTNYAGLSGGYGPGGFVTDEMMGTLLAPLTDGKLFRLRVCLSLAESSTEPVLVEFVLANSANLAEQKVIHQVLVKQKDGWMQYQPPCFRVPEIGHWDRLIIRASKADTATHAYPIGYVYVDNVNICCCQPILHDPAFTGDSVIVTWNGPGQLQGATALGDPTEWHDIDTMVEQDPDTGEFMTKIPRERGVLFFRVLGPDGTVECSECGS